MKKRTLLYLFLLSLLHAAPLHAYWYTKQIDIRSGLSQPSVTAVAVDNKGVVWIGTRYGLEKYRNGHLKSYADKGEAVPPLTGNQVSFLFRQADGTLWASTDRGLSRYDGNEDRFELMRSEAVLCALETSRSIYFGGYEGLLTYDKQTGAFARETLEEDGEGGPVVVGLFNEGPERVLALCRTPQLVSIDCESGQYRKRPIEGLDGKMVQTAYLFGGALYVSVYREGIFHVDPAAGTVRRQWNSRNSALSYDIVMSMTVMRGKLCLATDGGGICLLDPVSGEVCSLKEQLHLSSEPFPTGSFSAIHVSPDGSLWAGSVRHGLFTLRETALRSLGRNDGLAETIVNGLYRTGDGRVWIATDGGGLYAYDPAAESLRVCRGTEGEKVSSVCETPDGQLLLSLYSKGLFLYNPRSARLVPFLIRDEETDRQELLSGYTPELARSGNDLYILASSAYRYTLAGRGKVEPIGPGPDFSGMHLFGMDREGRLLFFSYLDVWRLVPESLAWERLYRAEDSHFINAAALTADDTVWLGTDYGIKCLRTDTGEVSVFRSDLFNRVTSLQATGDGLLWVAADNALFRYDLPGGQLELVDEGDGFSPNEILCSIASGADGYPLYFGTPDGVVILSGDTRKRPEQLEPERYEAFVDGQRIFSDGEIVLPRDYKNVEVTVNIRGLNHFSRRQIRFILSGEGLRQVHTSYEDSYRIGQLPPGRYTLTASCRMNSGEWSPDTPMLRFRVLRPWYRTGWFYLLLLLSASAVVYLLWKSRRRPAPEPPLLLEMPDEQDPKPLSADELFMLRLDGIIAGRLGEQNLDVAAIASEMAISRASLYNKMKAITGMGVAEYVDGIRIRKACEMLSGTSAGVSEIAYRLGFSSPRYFSSRFKKVMGVSPLSYRHSHKMGNA